MGLNVDFIWIGQIFSRNGKNYSLVADQWVDAAVLILKSSLAPGHTHTSKYGIILCQNWPGTQDGTNCSSHTYVCLSMVWTTSTSQNRTQWSCQPPSHASQCECTYFLKEPSNNLSKRWTSAFCLSLKSCFYSSILQPQRRGTQVPLNRVRCVV